jgi:hypothetical protein
MEAWPRFVLITQHSRLAPVFSPPVLFSFLCSAHIPPALTGPPYVPTSVYLLNAFTYVRPVRSAPGMVLVTICYGPRCLLRSGVPPSRLGLAFLLANSAEGVPSSSQPHSPCDEIGFSFLDRSFPTFPSFLFCRRAFLYGCPHDPPLPG